jgi:hypothetical protein
MNQHDAPGKPDGGAHLGQRSIRLLAVALLLLIGGLTLPKIAPRWQGIFIRDEARQTVWRAAAGTSDHPNAARTGDVVLVVAAASACGAVLLGLGFLALRRTKQPLGGKSGREDQAANGN